jgi:hypothetical protein
MPAAASPITPIAAARADSTGRRSTFYLDLRQKAVERLGGGFPAQYLLICYTKRLAEAGIKPTVGSVGDSYDNALSETINGL